MAKPNQLTTEDDALLAELGIEIEAPKAVARSPREERIIAGFEEIERFVEQHGHPPQHHENGDIFERLYAVRLDKIRNSEECRALLEGHDKMGLLYATNNQAADLPDDLDDDALLAELGITRAHEPAITQLQHVRSQAERQAAEEIANKEKCLDFALFKPLFRKVNEKLKSGEMVSRRFKMDASANITITKGDFFILGGQTAFVAEVGDEFKAPNGEYDARLRVIYDNGTESNLLRRSLQRALYKDDYGRRLSQKETGLLFSDEAAVGDIESGTIYVLRSFSEVPYIQQHRELLHKIGVTGGDLNLRLANVQHDPTFLMAEVEVVTTYKLANINRIKIEKLIHKFFAEVRLDIEIIDRFGIPIQPREWFLLPLSVIDEAIEKIIDGSITDCYYEPATARIVKLPK